jgi:small subunit ribosomal protein S3Ae
LKKPKFDLGRLLDIHGQGGSASVAAVSGGDAGLKIDRPDGYEPPVLESV